LTRAYIDSSLVVAGVLGEPSHAELLRRVRRASVVVTSSLTEAEVASTMAREQFTPRWDPLSGIELVAAPASLATEIGMVLAAGYLRGADCWHLAVALHYAPARDLTFLTLNKPQRAVAKALGFSV